jgi:DNA-binding Lrp family transcriptional regulator
MDNTGGAVDTLDVRILRALVRDQSVSPVSQGIRRSFGSIARTVGADEGTVRNRIRRMHETGFIEAWRLMLNPNLFGYEDILVWFDARADVPKSELIDQLRLVPGVYLVCSCHSSFHWVAIRRKREPPLARTLGLIQKLAKAERVDAGILAYPACNIRFSESDWAVLRAIYREPRKSRAAVAKEVGLSSRTVERKLQRMTRENAIFAFPALDPRGLQGSVMAAVLVTLPRERREEVDQRVVDGFGDYLWYVMPLIPVQPGGPMVCAYNLMLPNLSIGREVLKAVTSVHGILTVRLELFEEVHTLFDPLEEDVERHSFDRVLPAA